MNLNSFDANSVTQPGGLYAGINQGLLESLKAYFAFKDRQQQGERQMVRDERTNKMVQTDRAINMARRLGVRPPADQVGWTNPSEINPLLDASVQQFTQAEQDRQMAELGKRMQLIRSGVQLPDMSPAEAAEFSRVASDRALGLKRQGVQDQLAGVQLQSAKNQAFTSSPAWKAAAGVGNTLSEWVSKGIEAAGKRRDDPVLGRLRMELAKAESAPMYSPWEQTNMTPLTGKPLDDYRAQLRAQIAQFGGEPQASGGPQAGAGQPVQPGVETSDAAVTTSNDFLPEDGYDDQTIAALTHAKFTPKLIKEWVDAANAAGMQGASVETKKRFTDGLAKLNPVERNALMMAINNKAR